MVLKCVGFNDEHGNPQFELKSFVNVEKCRTKKVDFFDGRFF